MTQQDTNILDRKLKGWNLRTMLYILGIVACVLRFAYGQYSNVMDKLELIDRRLETITVNQAFQQKTLDRHELLITSNR